VGARQGSQISTGRKGVAHGSAVLETLSMGSEMELSDFEEENALLKGQYLWQAVEIVIGGKSTGLEVRFICLLMSLGWILLKGSISTNLFDPMRH
jgi:hypothetical protein